MRRLRGRLNCLRKRGFTVVELLIVVLVIAILTAIAYVGYSGVQRRSADTVTRHTIADALKALQLYNTFNRNYPSNIAGTDYVAPQSVALALYTNSQYDPVYTNLTADQNAQLFLNSCNGFMPIVVSGTTYNTACVYNGNNAHIKGQASSNVVISGPQIDQSEFVLTCGGACTTVQNQIIAKFVAQGGHFPVMVPKTGATLPEPTTVDQGVAQIFCLEARSGAYTDIVYHTTSGEQTIDAGSCNTSGLHYP